MYFNSGSFSGRNRDGLQVRGVLFKTKLQAWERTLEPGLYRRVDRGFCSTWWHGILKATGQRSSHSTDRTATVL